MQELLKTNFIKTKKNQILYNINNKSITYFYLFFVLAKKNIENNSVDQENHSSCIFYTTFTWFKSLKILFLKITKTCVLLCLYVFFMVKFVQTVLIKFYFLFNFK